MRHHHISSLRLVRLGLRGFPISDDKFKRVPFLSKQVATFLQNPCFKLITFYTQTDGIRQCCCKGKEAGCLKLSRGEFITLQIQKAGRHAPKPEERQSGTCLGLNPKLRPLGCALFVVSNLRIVLRLYFKGTRKYQVNGLRNRTSRGYYTQRMLSNTRASQRQNTDRFLTHKIHGRGKIQTFR